MNSQVLRDTQELHSKCPSPEKVRFLLGVTCFSEAAKKMDEGWTGLPVLYASGLHPLTVSQTEYSSAPLSARVKLSIALVQCLLCEGPGCRGESKQLP